MSIHLASKDYGYDITVIDARRKIGNFVGPFTLYSIVITHHRKHKTATPGFNGDVLHLGLYTLGDNVSAACINDDTWRLIA